MSNSELNFRIMLQAILDKVKSIANIKGDIKAIEPKLPKVKLQGKLDKTATQKELNSIIKSIKPKVKIDADTTQAEKKIKKIGKQKNQAAITPTVDNSQVVSSLKQAQKETKTLWQRFTANIFGSNLIRMGTQNVIQAVNEALRSIKELDTIKTNIQMVAGTTNSEVNSMMQSYNAMAKELSSTTKEVGEAANEFLRMGESVASTDELIKNATILSKVGMIDSADAASYLISSMKGYQVSAKESIDIVNKLTAVDLEAAVSAGGLAESISRCSNIANNSGTSMDRLIGYAASIGEVTQESMSVVGNSLKSMYSRMNNIKIGRFIDDETGESLSDTEAVLNKLGIQLRDTEDAYRNFDDVLDDVGKNWKDFTQIEQNAISVAIAGTMQRERFTALMNNYSSALEYSEVAANSAGSALERYGVYQDSIEAKTNELTAAMESLSTNTISEELYSGIIEATTGIVEFIDKANLLKGAFTGLVAMGVSKTIVSIGTGFITAAKSTAQLTAAMAMFDKGRSADNLRDIGAACKGLNNNQLKLILSTKGLKTQQRLAILEGMGMEEQEQKQMLTTLGFAAAEDKATASTFSLKGAFRSLKAVIATNPLGAIMTAVTVATMVFTGFHKAMQEARQKAKDLGDTFKSTKSEIEDYKSQIEELHKTINDRNSSIEDVTNARKTLISVQDELIEKFGTEDSAIRNVTDAINGQTDALDILTRNKWQEIKNEFNDGNFLNHILNLFQGTDNIERMLSEYGKRNIVFPWVEYAGDMIDITDDIVAKLENIGIDIKVSTDDLQGIRNFDSLTESIVGKKGVSLYIEGNAEEVYNKILSLQNLVNGDDSFGKFYKNIERHVNSYKELTDTYKDFYDQYILYEKILAGDSDYAGTFKQIADAAEKYNEAFLFGNEEEIKKASDEYASLLSAAMATAIANGDSDVATYFENMYPTLKSTVEGWKFNVAFDANTDNLQNVVQSVLNKLKDKDGRSLTTEEILGLGESNEQYQALVSIAHSYNMSIEEMIELLKERNLVSDMDYQRLVGLFGQENVDKLASEDLEIAYQIKNVGNMTFEELQAELEKAKEIINEPITFSTQLTNSQESLDSFQSSVKSAADAYEKLMTGSYSSSELLDSIQAINKAESEMGESIDWEEIESLDELGDKIEEISQTHAKSVLSGAGIDIDNDFRQMLANIIQEAYESEAALASLNAQIDSLQDSYKNLTDIIETYNEHGYLTFDQFEVLY